MDPKKTPPKKPGGRPLSQEEYESYMTGTGPKPANFKAKPETADDETAQPCPEEEENVPNE